MILANFLAHPAVIGLIVGIPSIALGFLGYWRSRSLDKVAKEAGVATASATSSRDAIDALSKVNTALRAEIDRVNEKVDRRDERIAMLEARIVTLEERIALLEHRANGER